MGEKDVFFQAHVLMGEAMRRESLTLVNLISPGTGHVLDPTTHAEQMRRIGELAARGTNRQPSELRFVTWTLKYNRCHWLEVLGLKQHYARAEIRARLHDDVMELDELLTFRGSRSTSQLAKPTELQMRGKHSLPESLTTELARSRCGSRRCSWRWRVASVVRLTGKRPGLQGPIDDAFCEPFLCVRGTGQAWNPAAGAYADAALERFAAEWHHYFRGELPVKPDTAVTEEDIRTRHLILFGDPGSNPWIAKALPQLPLTWTKDTLRLKGRDYATSSTFPPSLPPIRCRAMLSVSVLNSGPRSRSQVGS
jgi:hypothetical protein